MNEPDYEKILTYLANHPDPAIQYATQSANLMVQNQELMEQLALLGEEDDASLHSDLPSTDGEGTGS